MVTARTPLSAGDCAPAPLPAARHRAAARHARRRTVTVLLELGVEHARLGLGAQRAEQRRGVGALLQAHGVDDLHLTARSRLGTQELPALGITAQDRFYRDPRAIQIRGPDAQGAVLRRPLAALSAASWRRFHAARPAPRAAGAPFPPGSPHRCGDELAAPLATSRARFIRASAISPSSRAGVRPKSERNSSRVARL